MDTNRDCYLDMEVGKKMEIYLTGARVKSVKEEDGTDYQKSTISHDINTERKNDGRKLPYKK